MATQFDNKTVIRKYSRNVTTAVVMLKLADSVDRDRFFSISSNLKGIQRLVKLQQSLLLPTLSWI